MVTNGNSDNYSETTISLWQYHKDEPRDLIIDSNSFKSKARVLSYTNDQGVINAEISVALKELSSDRLMN